MNVEPLSGPSLAARIVPPCRSTTALAIESPRPRPPNCRVTAGSPCSKASKMCGNASGLIPLPVSQTSTSTRPSPAERVVTRIVPPAGVNFAAFFTRFQITCWSRAGSASTRSGRAARVISTARPLSWMSPPTMSMTCSTTALSCVGRRSSRSLPLITRLRSSRSSISRVSSPMLRRIIARYSCISGDRPGVISRSATAVTTGASGVRSSWLRAARNRSLARLAVSAASLASFNWTSASLRAVMSSTVPTIRTGRRAPSRPSKIARPLPWTHRVEPSSRTQRYSTS